MKFKSVIAATALALVVSGCAGQDGYGGYGNKQVAGGLGGAALGGLLGSTIGKGNGRLAATGAGVLIGALVGSEIGRSMDQVDRMKASDAVYQAQSAPVGETIAWNNPDSGNYGSVTPVREGTSGSGQYCREFQQTIVVGGRAEDGYGVACRQPDGSWEVQ